MNVVSIKVGMLDTNCYIFWRDGEKNAVIVDPGADFPAIDGKLSSLGLEPRAVLVTHCHFDHIGAVRDFQARGAEVYMYGVSAAEMHYTVLHGKLLGQSVKSFTPDVELSGGETLKIAGWEIKTLHTPGHSPTSICYIAENALFSGDTLFYLSYGRTDFKDGSFEQIKRSITEKLFALPGDYNVYPGHDRRTSLDFERAENPVLTD